MAKAAKAAARPSQSASATSEDAVMLLSADHRQVESLFEQYKAATTSTLKAGLARKICIELSVHTMLEEEIFYPACRSAGVEHSSLDEAQVEHDAVKILVEDLLTHRPEAQFYDAKVTVLSDYVKHHVNEEEKPGEGIFAKAGEADVDMAELGQRIKARKAELLASVQKPGFRPPAIRSLDVGSQANYEEERDMERRYERERDEQGRFIESDEYRGRYRGGYRGRDDEDDGYERGGSSRGRGWYGNPEGHSRGSEEGWERRGRSAGYSRGQDYQDDDRFRGGSGRGRGWYGDPEGHSRASEEGWEHRGRGGYSRSGDYDEDYRSGGGGRGRGHGGWFGDPEGHSRASEEGWENRGRGSYPRGRDYDEDDRRSSGGRSRGHGGWFGDPEGHSRAAHEGWEERGGSRYSRDR